MRSEWFDPKTDASTRCKWSLSHSPPGFTKIAKPKSRTSRNLPDQPQDKSHSLLTNIPLEINDSHLSLTASLKWTRNRPALLHPLNHTRARDTTVDSGRLDLWRQQSSRWPSGDQSSPVIAGRWAADGCRLSNHWLSSAFWVQERVGGKSMRCKRSRICESDDSHVSSSSQLWALHDGKIPASDNAGDKRSCWLERTLPKVALNCFHFGTGDAWKLKRTSGKKSRIIKIIAKKVVRDLHIQTLY